MLGRVQPIYLDNLDVITEAVRTPRCRKVRSEGEIEISHRHDQSSLQTRLFEVTVLQMVDGLSTEQLIQM